MRKIIVNGEEHEWNLVGISYEEVLELAGLPADSNASVTYQYADPRNGSGILTRNGNAIVAAHGTKFNAYRTGNS